MGARTTVYAMLDSLDPYSRSIVTFERPVTGSLISVEQKDLNKTETPLAEMIREKVRTECDLMMLDELPDGGTLEAALGERLMIVRLRLADAVSVVGHLLALGVESGAAARAISLVAAQRLVRVLCEHCRRKTVPSAELLRKIGLDPSRVEFLWEESNGCESCGMTGFHGRTGIFEIWRPSEDSRRLIAAKADARKLREAARRDGMISLEHAGLQRVLEGVTSLRELARSLKLGT
jgi:type II secretory ATPase GspE/PulE/Tfp pilus assembly ATPase PilB-like protein